MPFADSALLALLARVVLPACFVGVYTFALSRGVHAFFVGSRSCRGDLPVAKTKISLFLQLFCDCGSLSASKRRKWAAKQRILLRFCSVIGIQGSRNNPQSQKSCRKPGIFVFSLPGWLLSSALGGVGRLDCGTRIVGKFNKVGLWEKCAIGQKACLAGLSRTHRAVQGRAWNDPNSQNGPRRTF